MSVTEETKSAPATIREKAAQAKLYSQHARELRRTLDAELAAREIAFSKQVSSGIGPSDAAELFGLQKSRWQILADNETSLKKLAADLAEIQQHLSTEFELCQQLIAQHRDAEVARMVSDFGMNGSTARSRVDSDGAIAQLSQETARIRNFDAELQRMVQACAEGIQAIDVTRKELSRRWRTI